MSRINLSFNLPEEQAEYNLVRRAENFSAIVSEFTKLLRERTKYGDKKHASWCEVSRLWWSILEDEGIDPYEV